MRASEVEFPRHGRRSRVTWCRGSTPPYSSLWIVVRRLIYLNHLPRAAFKSDFRDDGKTNTERTLVLEGVRVTRLARVLGESEEALRYGSIQSFPLVVRPLLGRQRVCRQCLAGGFHTVLFHLDGLQRCPLHNEDLESYVCCNSSLHWGGFSSGLFQAAASCRQCARPYFDLKRALRPAKCFARDDALKEIATWLSHIGTRYWLGLSEVAPNKRVEATKAHLAMWGESPELPTPPRWWDTWTSTVRRTRLVRFGGHLSAQPQAFRNMPVSLQTDPYSPDRSANTTFKCIRRRIVRHCIPGCRQLLAEFIRMRDVEGIFNLVKSSRFGPDAWAFYLWWQSCTKNIAFGSFYQRSWFTPPYGVTETRVLRPIGIDSAPTLYENPGARMWHEQWLLCSSLLILWHQAKLHVQLLETAEDIAWGRGVVDGPIPVAWAASIGQVGELVLSLDAPFESVLIRPIVADKPARSEAHKNAVATKRERIRNSCSTQALQYLGINDGWSTSAALLPADETELKVHRMKIAGQKLRFVLFRAPGLNGEQPVYAARVIERPLMAMGESTREAVTNLKSAMRQMVRSAPARQPLSNTERVTSLNPAMRLLG